MFNDLEAHKLIGGTVIGGGSTGWQRPIDWLEMPEVLETEEKFVGLFAVYDLPENFIALYFEGDYTVDWGDGTIENFNSQTKAQHSYAWPDISSNTLTSEDYRQVLVTVTPQSGQDLTIMDLSVRHDNCYSYTYGSPWLDLAISMPQAGSGNPIRLNWDVSGAIGPGYLYKTQRIDIIHAGNMSDFTYALSYIPALCYVRIKNSPNASSFGNILSGCSSLTDVILEDTSLVTDMYYMFYNCYALTSVPLFDTSSVTNTSSMFHSCTALTSVPLFNTSSVTNMYFMFNSCTALTSVPLFNTSSVTIMNSMFYACSTLTSVPLFDTSSATDIYFMFGNCNNLQKAALSGTIAEIDYSCCLLGRQAILDIFNGLATVSGKTIYIISNYGTADLTAEDLQIAINKGWTVIS